MSPIRHRSGGRGFKGGFDDQRKERFQPGVRGPEVPPPVWTEGINFLMTAHGTASGLARAAHASGTVFVATGHSRATNMEMIPGA